MTAAPSQEGSSRLDAIIASYLEAIERGEVVDREQFLKQYPEYTEELRAFCADFDRLQLTKMQPGRDPDVTFVPQNEPKTGSMIAARYKLIENIGEGGMGSVWVAEQKEPVKRKVAIKLIKAGMDSKQVLARFEAERQALALMDHPNIAKVFDGGMTGSGRPFFVMEYVKGVPFTEYCDKARLSLKERLQLFIPVCQAVQHAHHKGIVHRDLKPSNILICLYDGRPVPKVIDFGLAKAMHQSLTDLSLHTAHGMMVGTPLYMSPEQAELNNLDVDTRTDVYSLGVLLYELLTGSTPLEREQFRKAAANEVLRIIREVEPPRPSTRLSGSASLPSIAAQRNVDPKHLQRSLAGDLDWIVMKALEKERSRRYETANGLARDIERFLNEEAVEACPPSVAYRLKKFVSKHRGTVAAGTMMLLSLIIGIIGTTWGLYRATRAELAATASHQKAVQSEKKAIASLKQTSEERDAKTVALNEKTAALSAEAAARDFAERQLIHGLLRPIGFNGRDVPDEAEQRCFVDWAAIADSRLKLRVLEVAFEEPETALRVARRSDRVAAACISLSLSRRKKAIDFLSAQQRRADADPRIRTAAAWIAMELGSDDLIALPEAVTWLSNGGGSRTERPEFSELIESMSHGVESLPAEQAKVRWDSLIALLKLGVGEFMDSGPYRRLEPLAVRLDRESAIRGGTSLLAVLETSSNPFVVEAAIDGLKALAPQLTTEQIPRAGNALIVVLEKSSSQIALRAATDGLVAFAPRLSVNQITRGADALIRLLENETDQNVLEPAANGLALLTQWLSPDQITRGWNALVGAMEQQPDWSTRSFDALGNCLKALVPKLSPDEVDQNWKALLVRLSECTHRIELARNIESVLISIAPRVSGDNSPSINQLIGILERTTKVPVQTTEGPCYFPVGLAVINALSMRLPDLQITPVWKTVLATYAKPLDIYSSDHISREILQALAARLTDSQVNDVYMIAVEGYTKGAVSDVGMYSPSIAAFAAILPRLDSERFQVALDALCAEMSVYTSGVSSKPFSVVQNLLMSIAGTLDSNQLSLLGEAMIRRMMSADDVWGFHASSGLFVYIAPMLSTDQLTRGIDALIGVVEKGTSGESLETAITGLIGVVDRLSDEQVTRAADALLAVMETTTDAKVMQAAGSCLGALALRLTPSQVNRSAEVFMMQLRTTDNGLGQNAAMQLLVSLAARLDDQQQIGAAEAMIALLRRIDRFLETQHLLTILSYLDPAIQDRLATETLTLLCDRLQVSPRYFEFMSIELQSFRPVIMAMNSPRSLALLLQHPACIDKPREWMLQRFEELVLHEGRRVFLPLPSESSNIELPTIMQNPTPARRFYTTYAASAWIEQNWPDFNLETTHPVQERPESK